MKCSSPFKIPLRVFFLHVCLRKVYLLKGRENSILFMCKLRQPFKGVALDDGPYFVPRGVSL